MSSGWRLLTELGPLAAFFISYRLLGLIPATGILMAATAAALGVSYWKTRKIAVMPLVTGVAVAVFGGLTIYLQNDLFIKIKPTLINILFAAILLIGWARGQPMLKYVFEYAVQLDERGWMILSRRWGLFFLFLAGVNEAVWRNFPTDFWVNFKVFGMMSLTVLFTLCQLPLMQRHMVEEK